MSKIKHATIEMICLLTLQEILTFPIKLDLEGFYLVQFCCIRIPIGRQGLWENIS